MIIRGKQQLWQLEDKLPNQNCCQSVYGIQVLLPPLKLLGLIPLELLRLLLMLLSCWNYCCCRRSLLLTLDGPWICCYNWLSLKVLIVVDTARDGVRLASAIVVSPTNLLQLLLRMKLLLLQAKLLLLRTKLCCCYEWNYWCCYLLTQQQTTTTLK